MTIMTSTARWIGLLSRGPCNPTWRLELPRLPPGYRGRELSAGDEFCALVASGPGRVAAPRAVQVHDVPQAGVPSARVIDRQPHPKSRSSLRRRWTEGGGKATQASRSGLNGRS